MRKKRLMYNTLTSLTNQFVTMICGFILPILILRNYGSEVNGLVISITQFLGFIVLLEFGVGAVVQSALYKPLANNDKLLTSKILISAEKFFKKIAIVFLVYTIALAIIYPFITLESFDFIFTFSLILIVSIASFAQYYFGITKQLLLNADQRSYVHLLLQSGTLILNTFICAILIKLGASIQTVKFATALIYVLRPIFLTIYVRRNYQLEKNITLDEEPLKQKWNGLAQHLASVVLNNTDVLILTMFSTLQNVSIYSVYFNVVNGVKQIISSFTTGMQATLGNMLAKRENEKLVDTFTVFEWVIHTMVSLFFGCTIILILPFISVYTKGIEDANYYVPIFAGLITIAQASYSLRLPYNIMVLAAGHYKQTQSSAMIEMVINIVISVLCVSEFGLVGVAIGTFLAMFYRSCYLAYYLSRNIINREIKHFIKHLLVDIISVIIMMIITKPFFLQNLTYTSWIIMAIKVFLVCSIISILVNLIFYKGLMLKSIRMLKH